MKRLFIALSLLLSVQLAGAQSKAVVDAISDVDKAKEALANPKKAVKPASWINLGEAYIKAFEAPAPAVVTGMPQPQIAMLLGGMAPVSSEDRIMGGIPYHVDIYPEFNLYYDGTGVLAIVEVTKTAYTDIDPLAEAINAFVKAGAARIVNIEIIFIVENVNHINTKMRAAPHLRSRAVYRKEGAEKISAPLLFSL